MNPTTSHMAPDHVSQSKTQRVSVSRLIGIRALLIACLYLASCTWIEGLTGRIFNSPPVAAFTANPSAGQAPLAVQFDASGSSDPDGDTLQYYWDFGDGQSGSGMVTSHLYDESHADSTITVVLTVTDVHDAADSSATNIVFDGALRMPPDPPF